MDPRPSARTMCVRVRQALVVRGRDEVGSALGRRRSSCWRTLMLRASAVRQLSSAERELPLEEDERARSSRPGESAEGGRVRGGEGRTHRSAGLVTMAAVCEHQGNAVSSCAGGKSLQVASTASRKGSRCEGRGGGGRDEGEGDDGPCCSRLRGRSFSRASPCRPCRPGGCGRPSRRRSSEMARVGEEGRGGAGRRRLAGTAVRARVRLGAARLEGASSGGCAALRGGGRGSSGACGPRAARLSAAAAAAGRTTWTRPIRTFCSWCTQPRRLAHKLTRTLRPRNTARRRGRAPRTALRVERCQA